MLELEHVSKYYNNNGVTSKGLDDISLKFERGEIVAITGESGSGKSTLLNVISRLDTFDEGEIYYKGNETSYFNVKDMDQFRKNKIGFIFQNYNIIDSYTVLDNVMLPLLINGVPRNEAKKRALELIEEVGLKDRSKNRGTELSGGEKQRCVIARSLALDSEILACDEPTGNLDQKTGKEIIDLIKRIGEGKLVLIVTHNFDEVKDIATRKIKLHDGKIVEDEIYQKKEEDKPEVIDLDYVKVPFKVNLKIALRNLVATPKKTILSALIFIAISLFALFLFQIVYESATKVDFSSSSFGYTSSDKLFVYDKENKALDKDSLSKISNYQVYNAFYENKMITLQSESYNEKEDRYITNVNGYYESNVNGELKYGTNATKEDEFVLYVNENSLSTYKVGDKYTISTESRACIDNLASEYLNKKEMTFTLVGIGVSKYASSTLITSNDLIEQYARYYALSSSYGDYFGDNYTSIDAVLDNGTNTNVIFDYSVETQILNYDASTFNNSYFKYYKYNLFETSDIVNNGKTTETKDLKDFSSNTINNVIVIGYDIKNYTTKTVFEASLYGNTSSIKSELDKLGYKYYTPTEYEQTDAVTNFVKKLTAYVIVGMSGLTLIAVYFITYALLKKVYESKSASYTIFRTLGVTAQDMKKIVKSEMIIQSLASTIIVYILFLILGKILRNNSFFSLFASISIPVTIIYFVLTVLMGLLLANRFNKKLFKKSVRESLKEAK